MSNTELNNEHPLPTLEMHIAKMQKIIDLQQQVFEANRAKGFWEDGTSRDKEDIVALINSEFYEALEWHRVGSSVLGPLPKNILEMLDGEVISGEPSFKATYEGCIKGTWQEEIADGAIRVLDYTGGFDIPLVVNDKSSVGEALPKNFGATILKINHRINSTFYSTNGDWNIRGWSYVLDVINDFAIREGMDLYQHIIWKLKYNTTRPHKHGKKY